MGRDKRRQIPGAKRGQIIQRVLVDGWSPAQAAQFFAVPERWVVSWVADYRRRGMASLRDLEGAPERGYGSVLSRLQAALARCFATSQPAHTAEPAACIELRRSGFDQRRR